MERLHLARHRWIPTLVWAILVLIVSSIPKLGVQTLPFPGCDKVAHFIEYLILGMSLRYWSRSRRKAHLIGGIAFGLFDEIHQAYIPGREASPLDFAADAAGVTFGYLFFRKWD